MMKTTVLVCAAMLTFTASAFGMHKAGWFDFNSPPDNPSQQVQSSVPLHGEAAMRYRQNQNLNWRCVMSLR